MSRNDLLIDFRQFSVKVKLNWRDLIKYNVKKDDKPKKRQDNISYKIKKKHWAMICWEEYCQYN